MIMIPNLGPNKLHSSDCVLCQKKILVFTNAFHYNLNIEEEMIPNEKDFRIILQLLLKKS